MRGTTRIQIHLNLDQNSIKYISFSFLGYFSFLNEKGAQTAVIYTTIVQLVRERVYKFLSLENISAYTESHGKKQYSN